MFRRIKASLANPSSISLYRLDNVFLALLYILSLCVIATIPTIISTVKTKGISEDTKYRIREVLVEERNEFYDGEINDNTLTVDSKQTNLIFEGNCAILFPNDDTDPVLFAQNGTYYVIKLEDHGINVYFVGNKVKSYTYTELGLDGLNFNFLKETDYKTRVLEFERVEKACDTIVNDLKPYWGTFDVLSTFFRIAFIALIFDLLCALLARGTRNLYFKECFVMAIYAFALETIGQILDSLYGFDIFGYIGCFIGIIYYIIALKNVDVLKNDNK